MKEAFVIGDVHGCLDELKELIKGINRTKTAIYLVGDLIDRGKDSRGVINFVRNNLIQCVKGNHELMFIECKPYIQQLVDGEEYTKRLRRAMSSSNWFYNGGDDVFSSYNGDYKTMLADLEYLETLPLYIETSIKDEEGLELLVSHTWCSLKTLNHTTSNEFNFVWDREQPTSLKNTSKYYNIFGHTPVDYVNQHKYHRKNNSVLIPEPELNDGTCNLDTGCAYDTQGRGWLSGVFFPSLKVEQVKRKP